MCRTCVRNEVYNVCVCNEVYNVHVILTYVIKFNEKQSGKKRRQSGLEAHGG